MPLLEINNLVKSYIAPDGERTTILNIPEFGLEKGEQVALEGRSGSGKTTLLNIIAGILRPEQGTVRLNGVEMTSLSEAGRDRLRAENIGYVFQTFNLLQGYSALENVELGMMFGRGVDKAYARALLDQVGLADRIHHRPRQLSVGQQQRVALARALANHPKLVLADEPTGNLDEHHAAEALDLLRGICDEHDASLLLVSHDPGVLDCFERRTNLSDISHVRETVVA